MPALWVHAAGIGPVWCVRPVQGGQPVNVLDLFSGAGGAAMGYSRAGFDVVGVDIDPQPRYPFPHIQADALTVLADTAFCQGFNLIHASPPCQAYSTGVSSSSSPWNHTRGKDEPALIGDVHKALTSLGVPWVIENVMGARRYMPSDSIILCGSMFDRPIPRHRVFALSWTTWPPFHPACRGLALASARKMGWDYRDMSVTGKGRRAGTKDRWAALLGIGWEVTQHDLAEAIPPAYTEWIGRDYQRHAAGVSW